MKHDEAHRIPIFSHLCYMVILDMTLQTYSDDRSPKVPFQSISGHQQDSDSESSFGSYSEDDAEPAVPAPFGKPKKTGAMTTGRGHPDSCHGKGLASLELFLLDFGKVWKR